MKMNNKMLNEEFLNEDITSIVTGEEVANLLGVGALYKQGKEEIWNLIEDSIQTSIVD